jgi:predicted nucleotidyltransferase
LFDLQDRLSEVVQRKVDVIAEGVIRNPFVLQTIREDQRQLYAA